MDVRLTWTDCDEDGDYAVPNVLSPRDLASRPDNMGETVQHTCNSFTKLIRQDIATPHVAGRATSSSRWWRSTISISHSLFFTKDRSV